MTPAIPAGQSADVSVNVLETGGQVLSASLTITADSTQQVAESSETNNAVQAHC
jgi:subtilase family serine protease